jgi:HlyD family secretion protein
MSPTIPTLLTRRSIRRHLIAGLGSVAFVCFGVGGWAATTELSGAVIASGQLVVDSSVKKVQHQTGGIVAELKVREGDHVNAGDLLIRLDDTQIRANLQIVLKGLDENAARQAREEAERDGSEDVAFPSELLARSDDPAVARVIDGERRLFAIRRAARDGQKAQLREQIAQVQEQVHGLDEQIAAKAKEIDWIAQELTGVYELWRKNLVPFSRVTTLERDSARLQGERGALIASTAQAKARVAETELRIIQIDGDMRSEVGKDLAEIRAKTSELIERRVAAEDQLKRIDIRAPAPGYVHQLAAHTVGGVITAQGDPIMLIVPDADLLAVETKVQPQDIDQLHLGQKAMLRFSAFNQRTTPEIEGSVNVISADVSQDARTNQTYYTIRISVSASETARLGDVKLVAGMPVEAFIQTNPRTVMSYLVRPLHDQIAKSFREK